MKKIIIFVLFALVLGAVVSVNAENSRFRWFKIKYQCAMERDSGGGFQTHMTTIRVKKDQGQSHAEKLAIKEGMNKGCKTGTVTIVTTEEEK